MLTLLELANKHHIRLHPDGAIKFGTIEIYEYDANLFCVYLLKGELEKSLKKLGGKVYQEGEFDVVLRFPANTAWDLVIPILMSIGKTDSVPKWVTWLS